MVLYTVTIHPRGLSLQEAAKAWYLRVHNKETWKAISLQVRNLRGETPALHTIRHAVAQMKQTRKGRLSESKYANCGRKPILSPEEECRIVVFVRRWRRKVFCTCRYIRQELKLSVQISTIRRTLNKHGFYWRPVAKKSPLSAEQLAGRKTFVNKFSSRSPDWWLQNAGLVFDGVTLSKAPRALSAKQKHAAQSLRHMWMRKGEKTDPSLLTLNRYGIQLGQKMPLWGGFSGDG
jgi:hypothetical protein